MKQIVFSAVAFSMLMGAAAQAEISQGRIAKMAPGQHSFTLQTGETFSVDATQYKNGLTGFRQGDSVTVNWTDQGGQKLATSISGAGADHVAGKIVHMDKSAGTVTLDSGSTYSFSGDAKRNLDGFRTGDHIRISGVSESAGQGAAHAATIGSANANEVVGVVQTINAARGKLTLSDGTQLSVPNGKENRAVLAGLLPGDRVHVSWTGTGSAKVATSINPVDR